MRKGLDAPFASLPGDVPQDGANPEKALTEPL